MKTSKIWVRSRETSHSKREHFVERGEFNVGQTGAIERLKENNILSLNQIEYLIKKLSEAYIPIFRVHLKTPIELQNLIKYGLDAIVYQEIKKNASKSRQNITLKFQNFVKENK